MSEVGAGSRDESVKTKIQSFRSDSIRTEDVGIFEASRSFSLQLRIAAALVVIAHPARRKPVMLVRSLTQKQSKYPHDYGD
ncbi:hypothetical protein [Bradyrhizobium sp. 199]|uniref:hypothetical protein n=1 Tax=Bradyrhizobium sp. 199 TaxID=2782664 RepID=UPI001FF9C4C5|nr:hypothetical protein [Bradyrhizobium sp. 199]MCK1361615.1 hypothetical protein [Bradyrhizobium sp. 199]